MTSLESKSTGRDPQEVWVRACPDGPMLVRGAEAVVDDRGERHRVTRPVVAVCTCGLSSRAPWCDGTHQAAVSRPDTQGPERKPEG